MISPFPWRYEDASFTYNGEHQTAAYIFDANGNMLTFISLGNVVPNAKLMAAAPQLRDALEAALDALEAAASQCGYIDNRRQPDDDIIYTCEAQTQRDLHDAATAARQALESLA